MRKILAVTLAAALIVTVAGAAPSERSAIVGGDKLPTAVLEPPVHWVTSAEDLYSVLSSGFQGRVVIPAGASLDMSPYTDIPIGSNVTLIGEPGPLGRRPLVFTQNQEEFPYFRVWGSDVSIEGIHFLGSAGGRRDMELPNLYAIRVMQDPRTEGGRRVVIADNEFDEWTGSGVRVENTLAYELGWDPERTNGFQEYFDDGLRQDPCWPHIRPDDGLVRVERNYFHHNARLDAGYGVNVAAGAYATIEGNVFDFNRHAVSANGHSVGYVARRNYVLQGGFTYGDNGYYGQHFDVHGTDSGDYNGGWAGQHVRIEANTIRGEQNYGGFLGFARKTRAAFELRGWTANGAHFQDNVVVHDDDVEAIRLKGHGPWPEFYNLEISGNQYDTDTSMELATGDFDGDGLTDVFVATGTAWFFSRGGIRPWEYLQWSSFRTRDLGFADIDNDGRTDVLWQLSDGAIEYSKSGTGYPAPLTSARVSMEDLRFGDFDADARTDIFYTLDGQWYVWFGGTRAWTATLRADLPVSALLFGEFDRTPGTDIVAALFDHWAVSSGSVVEWVRLNDRLRNTLVGTVAADFDGNGLSDIAFSDGNKWLVSRDGRQPLAVLRDGSGQPKYPPLHEQLTGRFEAGAGAQVVAVERMPLSPVIGPGQRLVIWKGLGNGNAYVTHSEQNMR